MPDLGGFFENDVEIRIRPTRRVMPGIDWLASRHGVTRLDIMRALIFKHVYGELALEALRDRVEAERREAREQVATDAREFGITQSPSRSTFVDLRHVGKTVDDPVQLTLPRRLYDDLVKVAEAHQMDCSSYCRKVFVQQLEGERIHTNWRNAADIVRGF